MALRYIYSLYFFSKLSAEAYRFLCDFLQKKTDILLFGDQNSKFNGRSEEFLRFKVKSKRLTVVRHKNKLEFTLQKGTRVSLYYPALFVMDHKNNM